MSPYRREAHYKPSMYNLPPPPPPPEMPPLPTTAPYSFSGGDSWRPSNNQGYSPHHEFSFRNNEDAPRYPQDNGRNISPRRYVDHDRNYPRPENRNRYREDKRSRDSAQRGTYSSAQRGNRRVATAARPLLSVKQGNSPVQILGTGDGTNEGMRFLPADEMSDSDEAAMDVSESDQDQLDGQNSNLIDISTTLGMDNDAEANVEPPAKRRPIGGARNGLNNQASLPKWSNPDPYTSLPPVDDSLRKKKDVVKIIRKARIATSKTTGAINEAAANDDFISFGFEEDPLEVESVRSSNPIEGVVERRPRVPNAPSGPRHFSHFQSLHNKSFPKAPGTQNLPISVDTMGPPPGLLNSVVTGQGESAPDHDSPLGNRKRTRDDFIKSTLERGGTRRKGFRGNSNGSLVDEWVPSGHMNPTPWHDPERTYQTENMGFRLHKEICDFYDFVKPQKFEQVVREDLLRRLQTAIESQFSKCGVYCFGSFAAGLYLPNADMDVVIVSEEFRTSGRKVVCQSNSSIRKFGSYLRTSRFAQENSLEFILGAKVPLIKFVDRVTAIKVDVSFENQTGLVANGTFKAWKSQYPAMPILVTLVKQFLMIRGLNEVVNGGLGGFSVTCLVTSLLQNMPRVQSGEFLPEQHLGELLIEFLDFYGNQLDIERTGIRMDPPGYFDKHDYLQSQSDRTVYRAGKADRLAILDPNLPDHDISGGSSNIMVVLDCFSQAHLDVMRAMRSPTQRSFLDLLLGCNFSIFSRQRNRLRELYQAKWGNPEPGLIDFRNNSHAELQKGPDSAGHTQSSSQVASHDLLQDRFATRFFINPVNPNVPITAPVKRKKAKPKLPKDGPRIKTRPSMKDKARARAARLRQEYPSMEGIPFTITATLRATLIAEHTAKQVKLSEELKSETVEKTSTVADVKSERGSPQIFITREIEIQRRLSGDSTDNPITID